MKYLKFFKLTAFLAITFLAILSCGRDQEESTPSDPFIGNWNLKVLTIDGKSNDVSNLSCWKDTTLRADRSDAKFTLVIPNASTNVCENSSETYQWTKKNGTYYYSENGQEQMLPIQLLDNNQTLQLTLRTETSIIILSFRK